MQWERKTWEDDHAPLEGMTLTINDKRFAALERHKAKWKLWLDDHDESWQVATFAREIPEASVIVLANIILSEVFHLAAEQIAHESEAITEADAPEVAA